MTTSKASTCKAFCKNCKYFKNDFPITLNYGKCQLSKTVTPEFIDPISGRLIPEKNEYGFASIYRKYDCIDAKFYEYEPSVPKRLLNQHLSTMVVITSFIISLIIMNLVYDMAYKYYPSFTPKL